MEISKWIRLIGIVCIIVGAFGIINSISALFISSVVENPSDKTLEASPPLVPGAKLASLGIAVYAFYLLAGVFFLIKRSFSLRMVYISLVLSILYVTLPILLSIHFSGIPVGPFIDMILLIGILAIGKYYYKTSEELVALFGEKTRRKRLTPMLLRIITFIGLVCFLIPLGILLLWIHASESGNTLTERVEIFRNYFPAFLQGRWDITLLNIGFCISGIILSSIGLKLTGKLWKAFNICILALCILLLLMNLFTML